MKHKKHKLVNITNAEALELIEQRAKKEHRSIANTVMVTILEALGKPDNASTENTATG